MKKQSFEKSLAELENIVKQLEDGELDLDKHLELFEKGVILYKNCRSQFNKAEKKIAMLCENLKEEILEDGEDEKIST